MKDSVKKAYNLKDKVIITCYYDDRTEERSVKLVKADGKYDITRKLPIGFEAGEYLREKSFEVRKQYDSVAEIQQLADRLDGWHFTRMYIPETDRFDYMFVKEIHRYIGESTDQFTCGREYCCTENNENLCLMIGNDLHDHSVDAADFRLIRQFHYVNPVIDSDEESPLDQLIMEWTEKKEKYREEYYGPDGKRGWPAKLTGITFEWQGEEHEIKMKDIGIVYNDAWDEGFFEFLQQFIIEDLEKIGAENIREWGFLD